MKNTICVVVGSIGSLVASFFGGWDSSLTTLVIFMAIDFFTGLAVGGIFHKSQKTETGALESQAGFKGLLKKIAMLFLVIVGYRLDLLNGSSFIKDAICIAFIVNELISITENAGLMGIQIPDVVVDAIDILKRKKGDVKK